MNTEAYRAAGPDGGARFLRAVELGADYLLEHFWDEEFGGFYWEANARGQVRDDRKQDYANIHPILALAHTYDVTGNQRYLDAALAQLDVIEEHFLDPQHPGGYLPGFTRDFSEPMGVNNVDSFTHYFEALLALYDVTDGETREEIIDKIVLEGNFLVDMLYTDQEGFDDRGYVAYNYDGNWRPSQEPYTRETQWSGALHATTGHNVELAYLLSRAVERGFNPEWLDTADKLMRFALEYAMHPEYGGMIYDTTDYEGQPLEGNPDNPYFVWWSQGETARALLHFLVVRGRDDYAEPFLKQQAIIDNHLTDLEYGGWTANLDSTRDLAPLGYDKGNIWMVNYHTSMYYAEILRLAAEYPERLTELEAELNSLPD
jgi:mannose/cellobiose epimerase-like protein (N-acyl-D-glucosamine 2-epimerase family)